MSQNDLYIPTDSTKYSFINLLVSTDFLLIILSVSSVRMFVITITFAVALVVLISLYYLFFNKIRKKCREAVTINT